MPRRTAPASGSERREPVGLTHGSAGSNGRHGRIAEPQPTAENSWTARYGEVAIRDGMATIPWALYAYQGRLGMAAPEVWFVSAILAQRWDAQLPHPSLKQMVVQSGVSLRQLQNLRSVLCGKGLLEVSQRQGSNGAQQSNSYDFRELFARLDTEVLADKPPDNHILDDDAPPRLAADPADRSFVGRYGRVLTGAGVIAVPRGLYTHQALLGLSPQDCWFTTYILAHKWTGDLPYPSLRKMADRTGYSVKQLHSIKDGLAQRGLLRIVERYDQRGGRTANGYDFGPLLANLLALLEPNTSTPQPIQPTPGSVPGSRRGRARLANGHLDTQTEGEGMQSASLEGMQKGSPGRMPVTVADGMQRTSPAGVKITSSRGMQRSSSGGTKNHSPGGMQRTSTGRVQMSSLEGDADSYTTWDAEEHQGPGADSHNKGDAERFTRRISLKEDRSQEEGNSNRQLPVEEDVLYSPYIAQVVRDHSVELGDRLHWISNVTQALRLWRRSRLGEEAFVALMHDTRSRVRQYQGKQGTGLIANKMAYYFQVLRQFVLGADGDADDDDSTT